MRAKLALQPEHYDSVTLHVGAGRPREDDAEDAARAGADLSVQYGDEITSDVRKTPPKRKLIAEWIEPRCSPARSSRCASSAKKKAAR